jgi:hypothetical protein
MTSQKPLGGLKSGFEGMKGVFNNHSPRANHRDPLSLAKKVVAVYSGKTEGRLVRGGRTGTCTGEALR